MMALSNRLPLRLMKPACGLSGSATVRMTFGSRFSTPLQLSPIDLPLTVSASGLGSSPAFISSVDHGRHAAGMVVVLAEIFAGRLQIDQQRDLVAELLPVVIVERHAEMAGDGVQMDRRVGRAADRRIDDDGVLESLARHDVGRLQILIAPSRRCACRSRRRSGRARDRAPEWRPSPAAACRAPRPASSSSSPCPWCCSSRPTAPTMRPCP